MPNITIQPELKDLLQIVRSNYSGIYGVHADLILTSLETQLWDFRRLVEGWLSLKGADLVYLSDQQRQRLKDSMEDCEKQNPDLSNYVAHIRAECGREFFTETEELNRLSNLIFPNSSYNSTQLHQELKRLKIQDLTIQIPLKKRELEQITNDLENNLGGSAKYLLSKVIKKQQKFLINNETNSDKLEEMKQSLKEDLGDDSEKLEEILNKEKELFNLEKHLKSLLTIE